MTAIHKAMAYTVLAQCCAVQNGVMENWGTRWYRIYFDKFYHYSGWTEL